MEKFSDLEKVNKIKMSTADVELRKLVNIYDTLEIQSKYNVGFLD